MDDFEDRRGRRFEPGSDTFGVHSTAGAVPVSCYEDIGLFFNKKLFVKKK